ncbi:MAG: hypothetical protein H7843_01910 [Nitrospirota bacterium]
MGIKINTLQLRELILNNKTHSPIEIDQTGDVYCKGDRRVVVEFVPRIDRRLPLGESLTMLKLQILAAARVSGHHVSFTS